MKINCVIVTYNRLSLLKECISALKNQTYKINKIYIINNNSTDGTSDYLQELIADSQFVIVYNTVINLCKLFKCASDFGTFSGHGFQCDMTRGICCQDRVESFDDLADSGVSSGSYMRTRMKYQSMAFAGGSALNLLCQEFDCKFKCFRFYRISQIDHNHTI